MAEERLPKISELFARLPPASDPFRATISLDAVEQTWPEARRRGSAAGRYHYFVGLLLSKMERGDSAMYHFAEASLIFDRHDEVEWLLQSNYGQAYELAVLPGYAEKEHLLQRVIDGARTHGLRDLEAKAYGLRAYLLEIQGDYTAAIEWYRRALAIHLDQEQWGEALLILNNLGNSAFWAPRHRECRQFYERALAIQAQHQTDQTDIVASVHIGLSVLASNYDDYALAREHLDQVPALLARKNTLEHWITYYACKLELFEQRAMYDSAYYCTWEYNYLQDSLSEQRDRRATAENMILYRTRDAEADRLRAELESANLRTQRNLTGGGLALFGIGLATLVYLFRQRRKAARLQLENLAIRQEGEINALKQENQLNMVQALLEGQETERDRIARDLHDGLGGDLTGLRWTYNELVSDLEQQGYRHAMLSGIRTELGRAYEKVRNLSHELSYSDLRQFGLVSSLRRLVERLKLTGKLRVTLGTYGKARRLDTNTEIQLFQLVNELCTNTLKHAGAERISIELTWLPEVLSLIVEDNGCGFDASEAEAGLGLYSMRQRAQSIGASFEIDSRPGRGTTALIDLPLLPVEAPVGA